MRDDDAFRIGGRARGEHDLGDVVARDGDGRRIAAAPFHLVQLPHRRVDRRADWRHVLTDRDQTGADDGADAREKIGRGSIIDRHDDDADEQTTPERDDPLRTVLAPDDNFVAFPESQLVQACGESVGRAADIVVRVTSTSEPIVVHDKLAARVREISKKVNQRVTDHE